MSTPFVCGSRASPLALWQAREVVALLRAHDPERAVEVRVEEAHGDVVLDASLASLAAANPGVFTKELEVGLLAGVYDLAVHSLKDMPTALPPGLALVGITAREDPRDALVLAPRHAAMGVTGLADLPRGSVVGTSSVRREAFLRRAHAHLTSTGVRGNLTTRLRKLDAMPPSPVALEELGSSSVSGGAAVDGATAVAAAHYDALLLASAGLLRMGWADRISARLDADDCPYGVGQGALGLEAREGDAVAAELARAVTHPATALRCLAERSFLNALQGGCQAPLGVDSRIEGLRKGGGDASEHSSGGAWDEASLPEPSGPAACVLVLSGTLTSPDGSVSVTAQVREAVSLPPGRALRTVNAHGGGGGGGGGGNAESSPPTLPPGALRVRLGVSALEWEQLLHVGTRVGRALASKLLASREGGELAVRLGLGGGVGRGITWGEA